MTEFIERVTFRIHIFNFLIKTLSIKITAFTFKKKLLHRTLVLLIVVYII